MAGVLDGGASVDRELSRKHPIELSRANMSLSPTVQDLSFINNCGERFAYHLPTIVWSWSLFEILLVVGMCMGVCLDHRSSKAPQPVSWNAIRVTRRLGSLKSFVKNRRGRCKLHMHCKHTCLETRRLYCFEASWTQACWQPSHLHWTLTQHIKTLSFHTGSISKFYLDRVYNNHSYMEPKLGRVGICRWWIHARMHKQNDIG